MNDALTQILTACVPVLCLLITAGGAYAVALIKRSTAKVEQQLDNEMATKYIEMASEAVAQAVAFTSQTFADTLKSEGAFTKEKQIEAFNIAKNKALEIMTDTALDAINDVYGDLDTWLETKIEQACREIKLEVE